MLTVGETLREGRYKILFPIAEKPTSSIFLARDEENRELYAIKVIQRKSGEHEDFRKAFSNEAKSLAQMRDDPHIARFEHFGVEEKYLYIVMEYVPGKTIAEFIKTNKTVSEKDALKIARQIAEALQSAHEKGIIHSDIKPSNIMLTPGGNAKVVDFGMALDVSNVTSSQIAGTPAYFSPEQVDPLTFGTPQIQSDIYSLGATLYEMLCGRPPFQFTTTLLQLAKDIAERTPTPVSKYNEEILPEVEDLVKRCLEKHPEDRFKSPRELIEAIDRLGLDGEDVGCARLKQAKRQFQLEEWDKANEWCRRVPQTSDCFTESQELLGQIGRRIKEQRLKTLERGMESAVRSNDWDRVSVCARDLLAIDPHHARAQELVSGQGREPWRLPRLVSTKKPDGYQLSKHKTSIGRMPASPPPDIDLSNESGGSTVSRQHAWIIREPKDIWIIEVSLDSRNETSVNNQVIQKGTKQIIQDGDELEIGDVKLQFFTGSSQP
jgi:serine/threonine protein kinase